MNSSGNEHFSVSGLASIGENVHHNVERKMATFQDRFLGTCRSRAESNLNGHPTQVLTVGDIDAPFFQPGSSGGGSGRGGGGELVVEAVLDTYVSRMKQEVLGDLREDIRQLTAATESLHDELRIMRERQEQATCFGCLCWLFSRIRLPLSVAHEDERQLTPTRMRSGTAGTNFSRTFSLLPEIPDEYEFEFDGTPKHFKHLHSARNGALQRRQTSNALSASMQRSIRALSDFGIQPTAILVEKLYVTGPFSSWKLDQDDGQLQLAARHASAGSTSPPREGIMRFRLCVQLSSMSFSFQVVNPVKKWTWHLYPRDAVLKVWGLHVSKEGRLWADNPDAVAVGLGDLKAGHQKNFHVMEPPGTIVTIWVEVPVIPVAVGDGMTVDYGTADGCRVWYTLEDTGVNCVGGDGIDLNKWKRFQAMFE